VNPVKGTWSPTGDFTSREPDNLSRMPTHDESSGIQVGERNDTVLVRVEGRGTHLNSHLLKQFLGQCLSENSRSFQIDLSRCTYMDSTFLGMLAGVGGRVLERSLPPIQLLNATERVRDMIDNLGIFHLFEMVRETGPSCALDASRTLTGKVSAEIKTHDMLEAHEKLVSISPQNEAKFRDVIELLREKTSKSK